MPYAMALENFGNFWPGTCGAIITLCNFINAFACHWQLKPTSQGAASWQQEPKKACQTQCAPVFQRLNAFALLGATPSGTLISPYGIFCAFNRLMCNPFCPQVVPPSPLWQQKLRIKNLFSFFSLFCVMPQKS